MWLLKRRHVDPQMFTYECPTCGQFWALRTPQDLEANVIKHAALMGH